MQDPRSELPRLQDFLIHAARRAPGKTALVCGNDRITYSELASRAAQLSRALQRRRVRAGDRVVIYTGNTIEAAIAFWGVLAANAIAVPISPQTRTDKLRWLLEHCGAAALITEQRLAGAFVRAANHVASLRAVLVTDLAEGIEAAGLAGAINLATTLAAEPASPLPPPSAREDQLAAILYTSGSTGRPKGVMLSHHNISSAAASICAYLELGSDDVIHSIMPLSFDYGLYQLIMSVRQCARLVLGAPGMSPVHVLTQSAEESVTVFPGMPTTFALLDELEDLSAWDLSRVRIVTSTSAALTRRHIATARRVFPSARVFSMYGVTECKRCTYLPPDDLARKPDSIGIAIPGTELWLVDEHDRRLGPNQVGQLVIRGPTVMRGYWRDPIETARRLRPGPVPGELVLYTGDLCRLDDDGYLYFVGRMDDIIKSRGEKVAPAEVEAVLQAIPGIKDAVVIGVTDDVLGQAVKAFIVLDDGAALSDADVLRACHAQLESFMVPSVIVRVPSLPRNAHGKIDRPALRA